MKPFDRDLRFLLKEKYNISDLDILDNKFSITKFIKFDYQKLKEGVPLAYIIGHTDFINCKIDLSLKPLIPRPETEFWINKEIESLHRTLRNLDQNSSVTIKIKILDLYCGSGCIGIALLKYLLTDNNISTVVDFADISNKALAQTKINLKLNKVSATRYKLVKSSNFSKIESKYDYIFANPPYVSLKYKRSKNADKLKYEPKEALFANNDGLDIIEKFLKNARKHLNPNGKIFMEFGFGQKIVIERMLKQYSYQNHIFKKDQYNRYRWVELSL